MLKSASLGALFEKVSTYRPLLLFFVKAVSIYLVLKYLYLGYVGLADPGGKYDLTEIFGNFNLIILITQSLVVSSEFILELVGYETISGIKTLRIVGSGGVLIEFACLGVELWIAFLALIFSFPVHIKKPWRWRLLYTLAGICVIHFLNIIRVTTITLTNYYAYGITQEIHDLFNMTVYAFIFVGFLYWIKNFSNMPEDKDMSLHVNNE